MSTRVLNRRTFAMSAGSSLLAAPFLRSALAEGATSPKRFLVVFNALGPHYDSWRPVGTETNFNLASITAPLAPHKNDLVFLDGLDHQLARDNKTCDHTAANQFLTGRSRIDDTCTSVSNGMSLDLFLAGRLGADRPIKHLAMAVTGSGAMEDAPAHFYISQTAANAPIAPYILPSVAFQSIFGNLLLGKEQARQVLASRKSTLDLLNGELTALKGRLGADGSAKLDAHLTSFRELERRLTPPAGGTCTPTPLDAAIPTTPNNPAMMGHVPDAVRAQMDIITTAMACDMTRVAALQLFQVGMTCNWTGSGSNHHELSHNRGTDPNPLGSYINDKRWVHEMYAYLLAKLKATPDGTGTLLDNTLVLFCTEMGEASTHHFGYLPLMLAGRAGGALRTGRYLRYGGAVTRPAGVTPDQLTYSGVPHNRLLLTIAHLLGQTDVGAWGETYLNDGGILPGLIG